MKFGYARISTPKQSLQTQITLLEEAGCEKVFSDVISGYNSKKIQFELMMDFLRPKDVLVVTGVDRLGRSTKDLSILIDELHTREIDLKILGYDIDTRRPEGKLVYDMMALLAENERNRNIERIHQANEVARARGKAVGRPVKLSGKELDQLLKDYKCNLLPSGELASKYGISRATLYTYLKQEK